jgi:hypothetical protein
MTTPWSNPSTSLIIVQAPPGFTGIFMYTPNVGAGHLVISETPTSGTDHNTNAYLSGQTTYEQQFPGVWIACSNQGGILNFYTATSEAGPWTARASVGVISSGPTIGTLNLQGTEITATPADGHTYRTERLTWLGNGQSISGANAFLTGTNFNWPLSVLAGGTYRVQGYLDITNGANVTAVPTINLNCSGAFSSIRVMGQLSTMFGASAVVQVAPFTGGGNNFGVTLNTLGTSAGNYAFTFTGVFVASANGNFGVQAGDTTVATNYTINSYSHVDLMPV